LPRAEKVTYDSYQTTSSAKTGTDDQIGFDYASDTATSNIESILGAVDKNLSVTEQSKNDGRIVTDKSVVYNDDDYNAFSSYSDGEFSVTMSALGQEWTVQDLKNASKPLDVIFVLDFSGSMSALASTKTSEAVEGETEEQKALREKQAKYQRWQTTIEALNNSMKQILSYSNNRVGVVCYSNQATTMLPLGRYVVASDSLPSGYTDGYLSYNESLSTVDDMRLSLVTSPALFYEKEGQTGVIDTSKYYTPDYSWQKGKSLWAGTNIQLGIQEAYNNFKDVDEDAYGRQPVIFLMSDGEPTFATYNYMDPANGPTYGIGTAGEIGSMGYYTILTANYFKDMISFEYGSNAAFYTIGFGIKEEGNGSYVAENDANQATSYYADDGYRRAVLSPTKDNVNFLNTVPTYNYTKNSLTQKNMTISYYNASKFLYTLLTGSNQAQYIQNAEDRYLLYDSSGYLSGQVFLEQWLRTINNPYASDYNYADESKIYGDFDVTMLENFLNSIIKEIEVANNYGFLLKGDSQLVMTDPLGEGMEVKGTPVLSYFGTLYKNPVSENKGSYIEYTWSETATTQDSDTNGIQNLDLGTITARVYTSSTGMQTVVFSVPEKLVPTLYPDLYKQFYYEELPIRLIYKVGLTDSALENAKGGDVFYTNLYDEDTGEAKTTVTFTPDSTNTYYTADFKDVEQQKTKNVTDTSSTYFEESAQKTDSGDIAVTQTLGNNGKLVIDRDQTTLDLTVSKKWKTTATDSVQVQLLAKGTTENNGKTEDVTKLIDTVTLNSNNNWSYSWTALPYQSSSITYTDYYIREVPIDNYTASYKDANGNTLHTEELTLVDNNNSSVIRAVSASSGNVVITNSKYYELPSTGGIGTYQFTFVGTTLMVVASVMYIIIKKRNLAKYKGGEG
jgi:LPXTG-motif cell wall-anchored protein